MIPLGRVGALHETMDEVSPLVTTLMSAGALGTTKDKYDNINKWKKVIQIGLEENLQLQVGSLKY